MTDLNTFCFSGNLTRDSELKQTKGGMSVLEFGLANNQSQKQQDGTWKDRANFFNCVMFGKRAEALAQYLKKGLKVVVSGSARHESWEDKETKQKRNRVVFTVDNVVMMARGERKQEPEQPPAPDDTPQPDNVDDIPF